MTIIWAGFRLKGYKIEDDLQLLIPERMPPSVKAELLDYYRTILLTHDPKSEVYQKVIEAIKEKRKELRR